MIETALTIVELAGVLSTLNDTKDFAKWLRGRLGADNQIGRASCRERV